VARGKESLFPFASLRLCVKRFSGLSRLGLRQMKFFCREFHGLARNSVEIRKIRGSLMVNAIIKKINFVAVHSLK
jgi:hypothetical protein